VLPPCGARFRCRPGRLVLENRIHARFVHPAIVHVLSVVEHERSADMAMRQEISCKPVALPRAPRHLWTGRGCAIRGHIHYDIESANPFVRVHGSPMLAEAWPGNAQSGKAIGIQRRLAAHGGQERGS